MFRSNMWNVAEKIPRGSSSIPNIIGILHTAATIDLSAYSRILHRSAADLRDCPRTRSGCAVFPTQMPCLYVSRVSTEVLLYSGFALLEIHSAGLRIAYKLNSAWPNATAGLSGNGRVGASMPTRQPRVAQNN